MRTLLAERGQLVRAGLKILSFSLILALASQIKIYTPFSPVPLTAQTLAVFLAVVFLGKKALLAEGIWALLGFLQLPVFALPNFGISFGYIVGFFAASWFLALFLEKAQDYFGYLALFFFANIIIYICGVLGIMAFARLRVIPAFSWGVLPFLGEDILKAAIAALAALWVGRRNDRA